MNPDRKGEKWPVILGFRIARGVAIVSASFSLIVCVLLVANHLQLKAVDPLNSPAVTTLLEKLDENPGDEELKEQIRALDLLARKAYFTRRWQIRTGGFFLLGSVALFLVCLKLMGELRPKLPEPAGTPEAENIWHEKKLARRLIAGGGAVILLLSLVIAFLTSTKLGDKGMNVIRRVVGKGDYQAEEILETDLEPDVVSTFTEFQDDTGDYPSQEEISKNWPSFRGPGGSGISDNENTPVSWDITSGDGVVWKTAVPKPGLNSPIIWGDRLFISGADESGQEVYCFDRNTGELLWTREVKGIPGSPAELPDVSQDTGHAASTMTTDGKRVFAIFSTGDIASFDFEGNQLWAQNLGVADMNYGYASSLVMYKTRLLIQYDDMSNPRLIALNAGTGENEGEIKREVSASWASPIVVNTGTRNEVIMGATPILASYDPETGKELWSVESLLGEFAPSPAYADGMVFAGTQFGYLAAISLETNQIVWEAYDDLPDTSSLLATDRFLIIGTSYGVVTCFNAKTGDIFWSHEFDEGFYSSPVLAGDKVYMIDRSGIVHIFKAAEEYIPLGDPELGEPSDSTPAFMDDLIFIRGQKNLYCMGTYDEKK